MTRLQRAWSLSLVCFAGACALFESLSGLEGGDAAAGDVATDPPDDLALVDGGTDADAIGVDARYCTTLDAAAAFCEDFDEPVAIAPSALGAVVTTTGGTLTVSSVRAASPPRSLLATSPTIDASSSVQAAVYVDVHVKAFTSATLSFDTFITTPIDSLFVLGQVFTTMGNSISLVVRADSTALIEEGGFASAPTNVDHAGAVIDWTASTWHHVVIKLDTGTPAHSSLSVDGIVVEDHAPLDARFTVSGNLSVGLGMDFVSGPATARLAYVDNVVVKYTP